MARPASRTCVPRPFSGFLSARHSLVWQVMFQATDTIAIPEDEFLWRFVRSGGHGGQNVNKVASQAVLTWSMAASQHVPHDVKVRLSNLFHRFTTREGNLVIVSQRYRDQDRNRADCLDKLSHMLKAASVVPKKRKKTRPTRGSQQARLKSKKHRAQTKKQRRRPTED